MRTLILTLCVAALAANPVLAADQTSTADRPLFSHIKEYSVHGTVVP